METIMNLLKPGAKEDDQTLYGSATDPNKGKVGGEGSHFGHTHSDSGVAGVSSPTTTGNPTSGLTGSSATKTADQSYTTDASVPIGTATTTGEREFPLSNTGTGSTSNPQSQTGTVGQAHSDIDRTAAGTLPVAAGTTAAAAAQPTHTSTTNQPPSTTLGSVHPGVAPGKEISSSNAPKIHSPSQPADDKCEDTLHGGAHVTKIARQIDPCYEDQSTSATSTTLGSTGQPTASTSSRSEALAPGAAAIAPGATGASATKTADPIASTSGMTNVNSQSSTHGATRDAAIPAAVGAGAGLAGASAVGSHHTSAQTSNDLQGSRTAAPTVGSATAPIAHPYSEKAVDPRIDSGSTATAPGYKTLDPKADHQAGLLNKDQDHTARNVAAGTAAGAGAGALAGHEYSKKEAEHSAKEQQEHQKEIQKEHEKEVKEHEKEIKKEEKQHEKEVEKQHKVAEKEAKQHEKELEKEHKAAEKEAKKHEKELEKERKQHEKDEKPGLIDRILHRGDSKKEKHTEEAVAAGTAGAAGATAAHEHNKLHKDPPAGYSQTPDKGYASQVTGGTGTTALAGGDSNILPTGSTTGQPLPATATVPGTRYGSGHDEHAATTSTTTTGTQPEYHLNDPAHGIKRDSVSAAGGTVETTTPYKPAPQSGYASQVTGGTGTTQLAEGNREPVTNPTKANPLKEGEYGALGYASHVTGGTGTTQLAQGTTTTIPTEGMVPGRSGSVAGVTTETPYVDGPKAGTGKYADQVTGGTGTTQLAQGQLDEVTNPRKKTVAEKIEEALVMR